MWLLQGCISGGKAEVAPTYNGPLQASGVILRSSEGLSVSPRETGTLGIQRALIGVPATTPTNTGPIDIPVTGGIILGFCTNSKAHPLPTETLFRVHPDYTDGWVNVTGTSQVGNRLQIARKVGDAVETTEVGFEIDTEQQSTVSLINYYRSNAGTVSVIHDLFHNPTVGTEANVPFLGAQVGDWAVIALSSQVPGINVSTGGWIIDAFSRVDPTHSIHSNAFEAIHTLTVYRKKLTQSDISEGFVSFSPIPYT